MSGLLIFFLPLNLYLGFLRRYDINTFLYSIESELRNNVFKHDMKVSPSYSETQNEKKEQY